jgi:hypothetical protein
MEPPALLYIGMGALMARIMLDGTVTRDYKWLEWLRFLVRVASIALLWPLMLFVERLQAWLGTSPEGEGHGH